MNINAENVTVSIGKKVIVKNATIKVEKNQFVGILGPNGSGKSTLLKAIYRMLPTQEGSIFFDGKDIKEIPIKESAKKLGVMTQMSNFSFDFTVLEVVMMGRTPHKRLMENDNDADYEIAYDSLSKVNMLDFAKRSFNTLSGGEKQRVLAARVLTGTPKTLILDEPTNHLDVKYQLQLLDVVKELDCPILSAMHDLNISAMYCDYLYAMKDGKVVCQGTPKEVITKETIKMLYEVDADVSIDNKGRINVSYHPRHLI